MIFTSKALRRCTAVVALALCACAPRAWPASCVAPPAGLVGWWSGDSNARDLIGTNHGILQGGATAGSPGMVGGALKLDGTNGFIQVPNAPELNPATLTVECWVNFSLLDTPGTSTLGAQYLVFKQNTRSTTFEGYNLSKHRYAADIFVWESSSASGQAVQINSVSTIQKGVWYYVVGVRDTNALRLYVNGQLEVEAPVTFPQDYGNYPLYFGTSNQSYWDHKLAGLLDEVALYNRALTSGEIAALYAAGSAGRCKAPRLVTQPQSLSAPLGTNAAFTVAAAGVSPMAYQWFFNGGLLAGGTGSALSLTNIQSVSAGAYSVLVSNSLGATLSDAATLTVIVPPTLTLQPSNQTVLVGSSVTFAVETDGSLPMTYQWSQNGTNLLDATSSTLNLTNVQSSDAGAYVVAITNGAGNVSSDAASLMVLVQPSLQGAALLPDGTFSFTLSGDAGAVYAIETSTNLFDWTQLTTVSNSAAQSFFIDSTATNSRARFYRARLSF